MTMCAVYLPAASSSVMVRVRANFSSGHVSVDPPLWPIYFHGETWLKVPQSPLNCILMTLYTVNI